MKKRFMPTLIAFVALAILLVYANYYEVDEIMPPGVQKPQPILGCGDKDITAITWKNPPEPDLKVVYNASGSRIVAPADFRSDRNETEGMLKHFAELKSELIIAENATDTAAYGIGEGSPEVIIETATQTMQLTLGFKTEVGGSYYLARKDDPRVFMVPGYIRGSFDKKLADLRDRQFFTEDFGQVTSVSLRSGEETIELRQSETLTDWNIVAPASYSADGVAVALLLQNMRNLRVSRFVEDQPAEPETYGFKTPSLKIVAINKEGREFVLEAGEMSGVETYVRVVGNPAIHAVTTSSLSELRMNTSDLREKFLSVPPIDDLVELTVADASGSMTLEKKETGWMIGVQKIAEQDIRDFNNSLGRSKVNSFQAPHDLAEYGLKDKEKCRAIELKSKSGKFVLWLGNRKGASLSLLSDKELIDISAELDDAFTMFMTRLRRPAEEMKTVVAEPYTASASAASETVEESLELPTENP